MAKGQMRSNREAKKPKAPKATVTETASSSLTRGMLSSSTPSKKKG
ncbi:MAG: hypothetical protein K2X62_03725 [Beijerinckiaceae bacterium]|jgi:hypothetical protein|nr:hypothetical protein [Beijerinckiaceae bacterium]MDO9443591.1 hypothetical protein [Beijerinckiaceae bacterium]